MLYINVESTQFMASFVNFNAEKYPSPYMTIQNISVRRASQILGQILFSKCSFDNDKILQKCVREKRLSYDVKSLYTNLQNVLTRILNLFIPSHNSLQCYNSLEYVFYSQTAQSFHHFARTKQET